VAAAGRETEISYFTSDSSSKRWGQRLNCFREYCPLKAYDLSYFSKMAWKKIEERTIKIISEIIIMMYAQLYIARCFPSVLDVMVLENINLSSDKTGRPPLWSNEADLDFCHQTPTYAVSSVYFNHTLISYFQWENCMICLLSCVMNWIQYMPIN
jgi:hypothetical protein